MARKSKGFPLSFCQERLWLLDQMVPGTPLYNLPLSYRAEGKLDVAVLAHVFNKIVERHESLRTVFEGEKGEASQRVLSPEPVDLPMIDLSGLPAGEATARVRQLLQEEVARPFDLRQGPLMRRVLFRVSEHHHEICLTMHHIVTDGWSFGVFNNEFMELYNAFLTGRPPSLPELSIQYVDFAVWQRDWLKGEVLEEQLAYWRKQLEDLPPLLSLPTDRPRSIELVFHGRHRQFVVPEKMTAALRALAQKRRTTLFNTVLAAFKVILYRLSSQTAIPVGIPVAGRNLPEIENLIGFFLNTLVLRTELSGNPTFSDFLTQVTRVNVEALSHQDLPFEKIVEELHPERILAQNPIFQVLATLDPPLGSVKVEGLNLEMLRPEIPTSKFDLAYVVSEEDKRLRIIMEYRTNLFDTSTIDRLIGQLQSLFSAVTKNPEVRIEAVTLLSGVERHQVLVEWCDTERIYPRDKLLHDLFELQVERTPDATAVVSGDDYASYSYLNRESNQLARCLRSLGVGPEVLVATFMERGIQMMVTLVGVLKAGGAFLGLDVAAPKERLATQLEDSGAGLVLTQEKLQESLPDGRAEVFCIDRKHPLLATLSGENLPSPGHHLENLQCLVYTSGSNGLKGTLVTARNFLNLVHWYVDFSEHSQSSRSLLPTGLQGGTSFRNIFTTLVRGGCTIMADNGSYESANLLRTIREQRVTALACPPSFIYPVIDLAEADGFVSLETLEYLHLGGEAIVNARLRKWLASERGHCTVTNVFGLTETSDASAGGVVNRQELDLQETVPIEQPQHNHRIFILGRSGQPQPVGAWGEIHVGGEGVARGYVNRAALTATKFVPDPFSSGGRLYRTGDLARWLPDGRLQSGGRADHQVTIRGLRIKLDEIEQQLRQHPGVRGVVAVVKELDEDDKRLVAYVEPEDGGGEVSAADLRDFLEPRVPGYMIPVAFIPLDKMPLSSAGKIDREQLPEPEWVEQKSAEYVAPQAGTETKLAQMYLKLLSVEQVGRDDNFFELGGQSLLALVLISRIREEFQVDLPLQRLFQAPTVAQLAKVVEELAESEQGVSIPSIQRAASREGDLHDAILVELQPSGSGTPVFCLHPALGNVLGYQALTAHLGQDRPVFGLQSPPPEKLPRDFDNLEEIATTYVETVRRVQKKGPYSLIGWSQGGLIAFEMARRLSQDGDSGLPLLALVDPTPPDLIRESGVDAPTLLVDFGMQIGYRAGKAFELPLEELQMLEPDHQWDYLLLKLRIAGALTTESEPTQLRQIFETFSMNVQALQRYTAEPFAGSASLFLPEEGHSGADSWRKLIQGQLDVYNVPGDHFTCLAPPNVEVLGSKLRQMLEVAAGK